jgi:hypothetical protein
VTDGRVLHPVVGACGADAFRVPCCQEEVFHFGGRQVDEVRRHPPDSFDRNQDPSVHGRLPESDGLSDLRLGLALQQVGSQDVGEVVRDPLQESIDLSPCLFDAVRVRSGEPGCLGVESIDVGSDEQGHAGLYWSASRP